MMSNDHWEQSGLEFVGFALSDCTVEIDPTAAKYLRVVHRTALELAVQNRFGWDVGGYWLLADQIEQLRQLPFYYSATERILVRDAVDAYIKAQSTFDLDPILRLCETAVRSRPHG